MSRIKLNEDNILSWLVGGSLLLSAVLGAAGALFISAGFGGSVFIGGLLATGNFLWQRRGVEAALRLHPSIATRFAIMRYIFRLVVMGVLLYLLIVHVGANIFGLLIGLSVLVLNITVFSIYLSTRKGG